MIIFMLLEVTTGCTTLNYVRTALRTSSVVTGTKLAVTLKCWDRKTGGNIFQSIFKVFPPSGPFPAPEEETRAGFRKVVF